LAADPSLRGTLDALSLGLAGVQRKEVALDDMAHTMTMADETIEAILADRFATIPDLASRLDCHFKNVSFAGPFILVGTADRSAARIPCCQVLLRRAAEAVPGAQQVVEAAEAAPASQQEVAASPGAQLQEVVVVLAA
jgi:hypothetical protein